MKLVVLEKFDINIRSIAVDNKEAPITALAYFILSILIEN